MNTIRHPHHRLLTAALLLAPLTFVGCGKTEPAAAPPAATTAPAPAAPAASAPAPGAMTTSGEFDAPESENGPVFFVYKDDGDASNHYIPSGYMGDASAAVTVAPADGSKPQSGPSAFKIVYDAAKSTGEKWAGFFWQDPENNWNGEIPGAGFNLSGAKTLKFWARGEKGGEKLKFGFGGLTGKFSDTVKKEMTVTLTNQWQEFSIDLAGADLRRVQFGFMWAGNTADNPTGATFYLDNIRYEF